MYEYIPVRRHVDYSIDLLFPENATSWILPFTSGGFLYIALVNVVPDLLEESSLKYDTLYLDHEHKCYFMSPNLTVKAFFFFCRHSLLQTLLIFCGVAVMAFLSNVSV